MKIPMIFIFDKGLDLYEPTINWLNDWDETLW